MNSEILKIWEKLGTRVDTQGIQKIPGPQKKFKLMNFVGKNNEKMPNPNPTNLII